MADFTLAHYLIRESRFDQAIAAFEETSAQQGLPPAMADEALLQTGFLYIQEFLTPGQANLSPEQRMALLKKARVRLEQAVEFLSGQTEAMDIHETAAAYAECGVAEIYLMEHIPSRADAWYRKALARPKEQVRAPVRMMAMLGLGVALFRQGRMSDAAEAFDAVLADPHTGTVLYGLTVPDFLVPEAQLWRATAAHHMGDHAASIAMAKKAQGMFDGKEPVNGNARAIWLASVNFLKSMDPPGHHMPLDGHPALADAGFEAGKGGAK